MGHADRRELIVEIASSLDFVIFLFVVIANFIGKGWENASCTWTVQMNLTNMRVSTILVHRNDRYLNQMSADYSSTRIPVAKTTVQIV